MFQSSILFEANIYNRNHSKKEIYGFFEKENEQRTEKKRIGSAVCGNLVSLHHFPFANEERTKKCRVKLLIMSRSDSGSICFMRAELIRCSVRGAFFPLCERARPFLHDIGPIFKAIMKPNHVLALLRRARTLYKSK